MAVREMSLLLGSAWHATGPRVSDRMRLASHGHVSSRRVLSVKVECHAKEQRIRSVWRVAVWVYTLATFDSRRVRSMPLIH